MKLFYLVCLLLFTISSCTKRLNVVVTKNNEIEVVKYQISEITTLHTFIEVRKGSSTVEVMKAESGGLADILIRNDSVIIQLQPIPVYKFVNQAFNYKIMLDTNISVGYWIKKDETLGLERNRPDALVRIITP